MAHTAVGKTEHGVPEEGEWGGGRVQGVVFDADGIVGGLDAVQLY